MQQDREIRYERQRKILLQRRNNFGTVFKLLQYVDASLSPAFSRGEFDVNGKVAQWEGPEIDFLSVLCVKV